MTTPTRYPWQEQARKLGVVHVFPLEGDVATASVQKAARQWGQRHKRRVEMRVLGSTMLIRWMPLAAPPRKRPQPAPEPF